MTKYIVTGGTVLKGKVHLHGAKNAGFKAMIAALLAETPSTICDLGLISEIDFAKQTILSLGGKVIVGTDPHCLTIDPSGMSGFTISSELSHRSRFSPMYVGPLLARFGRAILPTPGGDVTIGKRPINRLLDGLEKLGVKINFRDGTYYFEAKNGLSGAEFTFEKNTHNGTEILIMAAAKARGVTIINNAAQEPEIDDLIKYLNLMGAEINRIKPRTIKIIGKEKLFGAKHSVMKDRNEVVTFACVALATRGDVTIRNADPKVLDEFFDEIKKIGGGMEIKPEETRFFYEKELRAIDIATSPHPGFMTDWQPLWTTLMTQARGESIVHETVYERRFDFVPGLIKMGAKIELFQPKVTDPDKLYNFNITDHTANDKHAVRIFGPSPLFGSEMEINDIRSGATALMAGIIAKGQTVVLDPKDQIKRGYECLPEQLITLGAKITISKD